VSEERRRRDEADIDCRPALGPKFQKWQALGNDYIILEEDDLPFELTAERVRRICAPHFGCHSDGVLLISRPSEPRFEARLRIFNSDGSEAELSGNGAREAILYLHRQGWTAKQSFSIETAAGEVRPTILDERRCAIDMGRAALESRDFPSGGPDGRGKLVAAGRELFFQHVNVGNPQCVIEVGDELPELDLGELGPPIEHSDLFPNRTNVAFIRIDSDDAVSARIFERGVGETLSSGTGACGAAVAGILRGGVSPVTVGLPGGQLEVEVGEELELTLTGWAEPVFSGTFSDELLAAVEET
jgi:diaminopimelate epimerase